MKHTDRIRSTRGSGPGFVLYQAGKDINVGKIIYTALLLIGILIIGVISLRDLKTRSEHKYIEQLELSSLRKSSRINQIQEQQLKQQFEILHRVIETRIQMEARKYAGEHYVKEAF